jgi:hypothetical protein
VFRRSPDASGALVSVSLEEMEEIEEMDEQVKMDEDI